MNYVTYEWDQQLVQKTVFTIGETISPLELKDIGNTFNFIECLGRSKWRAKLKVAIRVGFCAQIKDLFIGLPK